MAGVVALLLVVWQSSLSWAAGDISIVLASGGEAVLFAERFVWLSIGLSLAAMLMWPGRAVAVALVCLAIATTLGACLDRSVYRWCEAAVQVAVFSGLWYRVASSSGADRLAMACPMIAHGIGTLVLFTISQIVPSGAAMAAPDMATKALMTAMILGVLVVYFREWRKA